MTKKAKVAIILLAAAATGVRAQQDLMDGGAAKVRAEITLSPLLHIAFGSGPNARDAINLNLNEAIYYEKGVAWRVYKQLKVFSIGTGYSVDVRNSNALSKEEAGNLYRVFAIGILPTGRKAALEDIRNVSSNTKYRFTDRAEGEKELDVVYRIRRIADHNVQPFNYLAGKDGGGKTYPLDLYYTIAPN